MRRYCGIVGRDRDSERSSSSSSSSLSSNDIEMKFSGIGSGMSAYEMHQNLPEFARIKELILREGDMFGCSCVSGRKRGY
jgi:hypothetical protein